MKKVNTNNFKKTLSKFTTGITIICIQNKKGVFGKTVNSFSSVSLKPPLVLFSLGYDSSSIREYLKTKFLSINILSNKQKDLSIHFAKKKNSFNKILFEDGRKGTVIIPKCLGNLECELINTIKQGDHIIFICKVMHVKYDDKLKPLSYFNSNYS